MEVNSQLHPPSRFTPGEKAPGAHCIGGWVDPTACLEAVKRKILSFPRFETGSFSMYPPLYRLINIIIWGDKYLQKFDEETSWHVGTSKAEREIRGKLRWVFLHFFLPLTLLFPFPSHHISIFFSDICHVHEILKPHSL
jgi:hypothetical protein